MTGGLLPGRQTRSTIAGSQYVTLLDVNVSELIQGLDTRVFQNPLDLADEIRR